MNLTLINQLEKRQVKLIVGSVLFLAFTALTMFMIKPLHARYAAVEQELATLSALDLDNAPTSLAPLENQVNELEKKLLGELMNVPTRELEAHIISALQRIAWDSEVNLLRIEPLEIAEGLPYQEIAFRLEIDGGYYNLEKWLAGVSSQLGHVVFKEYELKVTKAGTDPQLRASVQVAAYRVTEAS